MEAVMSGTTASPTSPASRLAGCSPSNSSSTSSPTGGTTSYYRRQIPPNTSHNNNSNTQAPPFPRARFLTLDVGAIVYAPHEASLRRSHVLQFQQQPAISFPFTIHETPPSSVAHKKEHREEEKEEEGENGFRGDIKKQRRRLTSSSSASSLSSSPALVYQLALITAVQREAGLVSIHYISESEYEQQQQQQQSAMQTTATTTSRDLLLQLDPIPPLDTELFSEDLTVPVHVLFPTPCWWTNNGCIRADSTHLASSFAGSSASSRSISSAGALAVPLYVDLSTSSLPKVEPMDSARKRSRDDQIGDSGGTALIKAERDEEDDDDVVEILGDTAKGKEIDTKKERFSSGTSTAENIQVALGDAVVARSALDRLHEASAVSTQRWNGLQRVTVSNNSSSVGGVPTMQWNLLSDSDGRNPFSHLLALRSLCETVLRYCTASAATITSTPVVADSHTSRSVSSSSILREDRAPSSSSFYYATLLFENYELLNECLQYCESLVHATTSTSTSSLRITCVAKDFDDDNDDASDRTFFCCPSLFPLASATASSPVSGNGVSSPSTRRSLFSGEDQHPAEAVSVKRRRAQSSFSSSSEIHLELRFSILDDARMKLDCVDPPSPAQQARRDKDVDDEVEGGNDPRCLLFVTVRSSSSASPSSSLNHGSLNTPNKINNSSSRKQPSEPTTTSTTSRGRSSSQKSSQPLRVDIDTDPAAATLEPFLAQAILRSARTSKNSASSTIPMVLLDVRYPDNIVESTSPPRRSSLSIKPWTCTIPLPFSRRLTTNGQTNGFSSSSSSSAYTPTSTPTGEATTVPTWQRVVIALPLQLPSLRRLEQEVIVDSLAAVEPMSRTELQRRLVDISWNDCLLSVPPPTTTTKISPMNVSPSFPYSCCSPPTSSFAFVLRSLFRQQDDARREPENNRTNRSRADDDCHRRRVLMVLDNAYLPTSSSVNDLMEGLTDWLADLSVPVWNLSLRDDSPHQSDRGKAAMKSLQRWRQGHRSLAVVTLDGSSLSAAPSSSSSASSDRCVMCLEAMRDADLVVAVGGTAAAQWVDTVALPLVRSQHPKRQQQQQRHDDDNDDAEAPQGGPSKLLIVVFELLLRVPFMEQDVPTIVKHFQRSAAFGRWEGRLLQEGAEKMGEGLEAALCTLANVWLSARPLSAVLREARMAF